MRRGIAGILAVTLGVMIFLTCSNPNNPFTDYNNAKASVSFPTAPGSGRHVGDTVTARVKLTLPDLIDTVKVSYGDFWDTILTGSIPDSFTVNHTLDTAEPTTITVSIHLTNGQTKTFTGVVAVDGRGPQIATEFQPAVQVNAGQTLSLEVTATGTAPIHYTWVKDGIVLSAVSGNIYSKADVQFSDSGVYQCSLSNAWGSTVSTKTKVTVVTQVTVNHPPRFQTSPFQMSIAQGLSDTSDVTMTAADPDSDTITYTIDSTGTILPANGRATLTIARYLVVSITASAPTGTAYRVKIKATDQKGLFDTLIIQVSVFDPTAADITPPTITPAVSNPQNGDTVKVDTISLALTISDQNGILRAAVYKDTTSPDSIPLVLDGAGKDTVRIAIPEGRSAIRVIAVDNSANHNRATSTISITHLIPPKITTQPPATMNVRAPARATWSITASGSTPLAYKWYKDPTTYVMSGATFTLDPSAAANSGVYFCMVSNAVDSVKSTNVTLTVDAPLVAPTVVTDPQALTKDSGSTATFSVTLNTDVNPGPTYCWVKNDVDTVGRQATMSITAAKYTDQGRYKIVVRNSQGQAISSSALLTVRDVTIPVITLIGAADTTVLLNSVFTDPGATARDDRDGVISTRIVKTGTLTMTAVGKYELVYNVSDAGGNAAVQVKRTVCVVGWIEVGSRIPCNDYSFVLSPDGTPYVAFINGDDSGTVKVSKLQGNIWTRVGGVASTSDAKLPVLRFSHRETPPTPYLAIDEYAGGDSVNFYYRTIVRKNQGAAWNLLGGDIVFENNFFERSQFIDMTISNDDSIFVIANNNVWTYDGTQWKMVGDTNIGVSFYTVNGRGSSVTYSANRDLYVAGIDSGSFNIVKKRTGSQWQTVGGRIRTRSRGPYVNLQCSINNMLFIVTGIGDNPWSPTLFSYNGSSWDSLFCPVDKGAYSLAVSSTDKPFFACTNGDANGDKLSVWTSTAQGWKTIPTAGDGTVAQDQAQKPTILEYQGIIYAAFIASDGLALMKYVSP